MHQKQTTFFEILAALLIGATSFIIIATLYLVFNHQYIFFQATSYGPWLEESLKFIAALILIRVAYIKPIIIPFVGVGFGFFEGLFHLIFYNKVSIVPFLAHIFFGLVMAYFLYLAEKQKHNRLRSILYSLALLLPIFIHLIYNMFFGEILKLIIS